QYLPWYDDRSMSTILYIGNPDPLNSVSVTIKLAGQLFPGMPLVIPPYTTRTAAYPGQINGPVSITAVNSKTGTPQQISLTARTQTGSPTQFNEVAGVPAQNLASDYLWTWFDSNITNNA